MNGLKRAWRTPQWARR